MNSRFDADIIYIKALLRTVLRTKLITPLPRNDFAVESIMLLLMYLFQSVNIQIRSRSSVFTPETDLETMGLHLSQLKFSSTLLIERKHFNKTPL
jgi:hypothetical protein